MKFRKKPIVIEAFQMGFDVTPEWYTGKGCWGDNGETWEVIETLEGNMRVGVGDWVIKGVNGEIYPCKPDIFEKSYESADAPTPPDSRLDKVREALEFYANEKNWGLSGIYMNGPHYAKLYGDNYLKDSVEVQWIAGSLARKILEKWKS